jgi:hypothetical protein
MSNTVRSPSVLNISKAFPAFLELNTASASAFQISKSSAAVLSIK